ncbi:MAG: hypothetical protein HKN13_05145 [Rhodothermales bacterium]|nr:hypothetical protein [Rhodothermales bacterium]
MANRFSGASFLRKETTATPELVLGRVFDHRFEKKSGGRKKGVEDGNSHYRKGVAGDWVNHFDRKHCEAFIDRFSDVLQVTGYEADESWVDEHLAALEEARVTT